MGLLRSMPACYDDVGQFISSSNLLARLRHNVALVDALTFRPLPAHDSSAGIDTFTPGYYPDASWTYGTAVRVWKGAFRWRTGMTTFTAVLSGTRRNVEQWKIYFDGVLKATVTPNGTTQTQTVSISTGYTNGQVVDVTINLEGSSGSGGLGGDYVTRDVYVSPISYAPSWPGTPTFSGQYTATKLNQLISAISWVYGRCQAVPIVPGLAQVHALGPYATSHNWPLYYGTVQRNYTEDIARIYGAVYNWTATAMTCDVYLNGSLITQVSCPIGLTNLAITVSLSSLSVGSRGVLSIFGNVTNGGSGTPRFTRWVLAVRSEANTVYPYATLNATPAGYSLNSPATLNAFLNSLSTAVANAKARIDAAPHLFNRAQAMRQWYSNRPEGPGLIERRAVPVFPYRFGQTLTAKGENGLKLGFGPLIIPTGEPMQTFDQWSHTREENITPADANATTTVYLDSVKDLIPGTAYAITPRALYAEEVL